MSLPLEGSFITAGRVLPGFVLAVVFAAAAIAKASNQPATRQTLVAFGISEQASKWGAFALPGVEAAVAIGLVAQTTAAAIAGAVLLLVFSAAIAFQLAEGNRPSCNCFGQMAPSPIGAGTLLRNGALLLLAICAIARDPGGWGILHLVRTEASTAVPLAISILAVLVASVSVVGYSRARQQLRALSSRLDELSRKSALLAGAPRDKTPLAVGARAPSFRLPDSRGVFHALEDLTLSRPALLVFTSLSCPPCKTLAPEIDVWMKRHGDVLNVVKIVEGGALDPWAPGTVLLQSNRDVADAYRCWGTPAAVLVAKEGTIASNVAKGVPEIRSLVRALVSGSSDTEIGIQTPPARQSYRLR